MEEKKFYLAHNSFVIFMLNYSSVLVGGAIIIAFLMSFLPDILTKILFGALFIGSFVYGILTLKNNKMSLVVSESSIMLYDKKRKNNVLLSKVSNEAVSKISILEDEAVSISKKDGTTELLPLSGHLKPYKELVLKVKEALYHVYGDERTDFASDKNFAEYIRTKKIPQEITKSDSSTKFTRVALMILYMVIAGLPTILGFLAVCLGVLYLIMGFLKGLIGVLS